MVNNTQTKGAQRATANGGANNYQPSPTINGAATATGNSIEIRSKAVESLIQPIINQLNYFSVSSSTSSFSSDSNGSSSSSSKGRSKRAHTLVESLIEAIDNFLRQGGDLANEYPDMKDDILKAIGQIQLNGNTMAEASRDFANDPLSNQKRTIMIKASKELLGSIANLLSIADMIDVNLIIRCIQIVQQDLTNMKNSNNQDELTHHFKLYGAHLIELSNLAGKKQADLTDLKLKDELASARAALKKNTLKLFTTSKVIPSFKSPCS